MFSVPVLTEYARPLPRYMPLALILTCAAFGSSLSRNSEPMMVAPRAVPVKVLAFASMSLRACSRSLETCPTWSDVSFFAAARISLLFLSRSSESCFCCFCSASAASVLASMRLLAASSPSLTFLICPSASVFAAARISSAASLRSFWETTGAMMMVAWSDSSDAFGADRPLASWAQS